METPDLRYHHGLPLVDYHAELSLLPEEYEHAYRVRHTRTGRRMYHQYSRCSQHKDYWMLRNRWGDGFCPYCAVERVRALADARAREDARVRESMNS